MKQKNKIIKSLILTTFVLSPVLFNSILLTSCAKNDNNVVYDKVIDDSHLEYTNNGTICVGFSSPYDRK